MHRQESDIRQLHPGGGNAGPAPLPETAFELCGWEVQPRLLRAARNGTAVRVETRLMQLLVCLSSASGHPVTREAIMQAVWGHEHVTEDALNRLVSRLRRVLADELLCGASIETIPKVGYRLTASADGETAAQATPAAGTAPARKWPAALAIVAALALGFIALRALEGAFAGGSVLADPDRRTVPLTTLPGHEIQATLSPDGNQVAFARRVAIGEPWDIYMRPIASDTLLKLTAGEGNSLRPAWSPDGQWIGYLRVTGQNCELQLVSPVGGPSRALGPCDAALDEDLAWAPHGNALVFRARGARGLSLMQLDTSAMTTLTEPLPGEHDAQPVFSPDGVWLAFARWHTFGVADVYVAPASGGTATRVTHDNLKVHGLAWDTDSRHLVYSSNRGGSFALWRVDREGRTAERVPVAARSVDSPVISRDGRRMVHEEWVGQANVFTLSASDPAVAPAAVTQTTRWDWNPQPAPDGSRFAFVSDRSGPCELWIGDLAGGTPMRLTDFRGPYLGSPAWSNDAQQIAFESPGADGNFDLYLVDAAGGAARRLTDDPAADRFPHYAPDGRTLLYSSRRSGEWEIWRLDPATGASERVTNDGGYYAYEDTRGAIYYSKSNERGLWRLDAGGATALVVPELEPIDTANWTLRNDRLWYVQRDAELDAQLVVRDLAGGEARTIAALPRLLYKSGLGVDAAGRVYFTSVVSSESDLLLTEVAAR